MNNVYHLPILILGLAWAVNAQSAILAESDLRGGKPVDVNRLYGIWHLDKCSDCNGDTGKINELDLKDGLKSTVELSARNKFTITVEGVKFFESEIAYNVKKNPVWIDLTPIFPEHSKGKRKGLLELKDDKLIIHVSTIGSDVRPTDFKQRKGLNSLLIVCKRIK